MSSSLGSINTQPQTVQTLVNEVTSFTNQIADYQSSLLSGLNQVKYMLMLGRGCDKQNINSFICVLRFHTLHVARGNDRGLYDLFLQCVQVQVHNVRALVHVFPTLIPALHRRWLVLDFFDFHIRLMPGISLLL